MSGECNKCNEHALECTCESLCWLQQNGWISVKDRLPKNEEECLVAFPLVLNDLDCGFCYNLATLIDEVFISWELENTINNVSHWRPLPQSPDDN